MSQITVGTIGLLAGLIIGRVFEVFRHDGIRDQRAELIRSYEVAEGLRQVLTDERFAHELNEDSRRRGFKLDSTHPVLRVVDDDLSFDNVTELSRSMIQHPTNGDDAS